MTRRIKVAIIAVLVCIGLLVIAYSGMYAWIQLDAHRKADAIWEAYPQANDKVEAVILRMQSQSCAMKDRNETVWILGRLSSEKALPVLEKAYTGQICEHENFLCQYELEKAICRCGGHVE